MSSLTPPQLALLIVGVLAAVGIVVAIMRDRRTYAGYEEYGAEARTLAKALKGELFRDGEDLVMSGTFGKLPTIVRFSNSELTPGLQVTMQAPASFTLSVTPVGTEGAAGRSVVRSSDPGFDQRFAMRSDQPHEVRMFLDPRTLTGLKRLCCSNKTSVNLMIGSVELTEMIIPEPEPAKHVLDHLKQMSGLAESLRAMPGAESVKLVPFKRERQVLGRAMIVIGLVATAVYVLTTTNISERPQTSADVAVYPAGIVPAEGVLIRDVKKWRLADENDFDGTTRGLLRSNGKEVTGRMVGDFSGSGLGNDVAYLLVGEDGSRRVVLICKNNVRYDAKFPNVGGIARIAKDSISNINWEAGSAPEPVDGDGLLLVRHVGDSTSAMVLFIRGNTTVFGTPKQYDSITLR